MYLYHQYQMIYVDINSDYARMCAQMSHTNEDGFAWFMVVTPFTEVM